MAQHAIGTRVALASLLLIFIVLAADPACCESRHGSRAPSVPADDRPSAALRAPQTPSPGSKEKAAALHAAIEQKDLARVRTLLQTGTDANAEDADETPALSKAAGLGLTEICDELLRHGAKLTLPPYFPPLSSAVAGGSAKTVALLLERGADLNAVSHREGTALMMASRNHFSEIMALLVAKGASVRAAMEDGQTPLHAVSGKVEALEVEKGVTPPVQDAVKSVTLLLDKGAAIDAKDLEGQTPLMVAAEANSVVVADILLRRGADINAKDRVGRTALMRARGPAKEAMAALLKKAGAKEITPTLFEAVLQEDTGTVRALLAKGEDANQVDSEGKTPLHYAAVEAQEPTVLALLAKGANPNAVDRSGESVVRAALRTGRHQNVKALRDAGAESPDSDLVDALARKDIKAAKEAFAKGASPNSITERNVTVLVDAIENEDKDLVSLLLEGGAEVNPTPGDDYTPLMVAARSGNIAIARLLIARGAGVNAKNSDGDTALLMASSEEMFRLLLELNPDVRAKDDNGRTVLLTAATFASTETLKKLLDRDAAVDVNTGNDYNETPLMRAAIAGNPDNVRLLLDHGADPNAIEESTGGTALRFAIENMARAERKPGHLPIVRLLLSRKADPNLRGNFSNGKPTDLPLDIAAREGLRDAELVLRAAGAKGSPRKPINALARATEAGDVDWVRQLLKKGANPNELDDGTPPLYRAVSDRNIEIVRLLLARGAKPDLQPHYGDGPGSDGPTPLMEAAGNGDTAIMSLLLKAGADPRRTWAVNETALATAAKNGQLAACQLLLRNGADINAGEKTGSTALMNAVGWRAKRNDAVLKFLLSNKANVNPPVEYGDPPLMRAAQQGDLEAVRILVGAGAKAGAVTESGRTLLMVAALSGDIELVQFVMSLGIDLNARDERNASALSLAQDASYADIVELLKRAGAKQ